MFRKVYLKTIAAVLPLAILPFSVGCSANSLSPDLPPHFISSPDAEPERPIDAYDTVAMSDLPSGGTLSDDQYRSRVNELYSIVVDDGMRPVFADADPVKPIYDTAVDILDNYILNEWHDNDDGEYKIVHAIHDYLVYYIEYDQELYNAYQIGSIDVDNDPAFGIDGVFINKLAVCDGLSRAFNFLCAIEGIDCIRMVGTYAGGPHAWNKVRIGGSWYNVDVTADAAHYVVNVENTNEYKQQLSHGYFLLSDETYRTFRPQMHVFNDTYACEAYTDYDYYSDKAIVINGVTYPCVIGDQASLNDLFKAISGSKKAVGKIEVRLDFDGKANINDADVYKAEIDQAYAQVKNPDFVISESQRPYFQYPNGVYLFLIYR